MSNSSLKGLNLAAPGQKVELRPTNLELVGSNPVVCWVIFILPHFFASQIFLTQNNVESPKSCPSCICIYTNDVKVIKLCCLGSNGLYKVRKGQKSLSLLEQLPANGTTMGEHNASNVKSQSPSS